MHSLTWLITTTTYGTWLPGDSRGFVGRVRDRRQDDVILAGRVEHDQIGTDYDREIPLLHSASRSLMKGEPVYLTKEQAEVVVQNIVATAAFRGWSLHAIAVMSNHWHAVVSAAENLNTDSILRDFKSYASRGLNRLWPRPASGRWWTTSGSRRQLRDDRACDAAIQYVQNQSNPLSLLIPDNPSGGRKPPVDNNHDTEPRTICECKANQH